MDSLVLRPGEKRARPAIRRVPTRAELRRTEAPLHDGQGRRQRTAGCELRTAPINDDVFILTVAKLAEAQALYQNAEQQMQNALRNVRQAALFIADGENRHPNRNDICRQNTQGEPFGEFLVGRRRLGGQGAQAGPFGGNAAAPTPFGSAPSSASAFGQPSSLGQRPNPFASPAPQTQPQPQPQPSSNPFGSSPQPTSAFGQPSALGAKPNPFGTPAFGQPSQPSAQGSAFGQATQPSTQGSAFGQASQLGQKPNPFASQAAASPSPFAAAGSTTSPPPASNPFGDTTNPTSTASPFGSFASNNNNNNNATSSSTNLFAAQGNAAPSAFGAAATGQNTASPSPFGQTAQSSSPFAQPTPPSNAFGSVGAMHQMPQSDAFGRSQSASPFAQPQPQANANPFAQQAPDAARTVSSAGQKLAPGQTTGSSGNPYSPESNRQHPSADTYITKGMDSHVTAFKGKAVTYKDGKPGIRDFSGSWTRIWFPDGAPPYNKDTELPPGDYSEKDKAQWQAFAQAGTFQDGIMPELPPPRECTRWDF